MQVVLGARRQITKKNTNSTYETFNAYIGDEASGVGSLIAGLRISKGKLLPPVKFNPRTKKFFNTLYLSTRVAQTIIEEVKVLWPDIELAKDSESIKAIVYSPTKFAQLLQHNPHQEHDDDVDGDKAVGDMHLEVVG
jgi:hypothetical protein